MEQKTTKPNSKALPLVLATVFIDVLGVGILIPVLPQLIYRIFLPAGYSRHDSLIMLGWLVAIYPLMQFVATPILGQLSDRYGRKPILSFSLLGTAVGYVLFAIGIITKNIPLLFFARAFDGITGGNISVARAVIADSTTPANRTKSFGLMGAMFGMGFVMGPYIGARLAAPDVSFFGLFNTPHWFGPATPFWFTAIISGINALLVMVNLPETHKHINKAVKLTWTKSLDNIGKAVTSKSLRVIFATEFLFWGGFTFFTTFFQILLIEKLGFKVNNIGDFFAYIGICMALTQVLIVPTLAKFFKNYQVLRVAFLGTSTALMLMLWPHNTRELLMVAPFIAIFNGMIMANVSALVSLSADAKIQGEVLGIEASVQALAQAIPAIIAGYVATLGVSMPVKVASITVFAAWLVYVIFYRPPKHLLQETAAEAAAEGMKAMTH
jgi:MFS transporter, DHA1 family, tetracycline resistance protein